MGKSFSKSIRLSELPLAAQADCRRQLGDKAFEKIIAKELKKCGRYTVSAKEKRTADGIVFDSAGERGAYEILRDHAGLEHITLQPEFLLQPAYEFEGKRHRDIRYVADFLIGPKREAIDSPVLPEHKVLDFKGHRTRAYIRSKKQFEFHYRAHIFEIESAAELLTLISEWTLKP